MIKKAIMVAFASILCFAVVSATANPIVETVNQSNAIITGSVVDAETGEAVANATVTLSGTEESTTTDEYGTFTFEQVENGSQTITVQADGYQEAEETVEVTEEGANVEIELNSEM